MNSKQQVALDALREAFDEATVQRMVRAVSGELERLARGWALDERGGGAYATDHACRECWPGGSLVSKTFLCLRHLASKLPEQVAPEWDLAEPPNAARKEQ